MLKSAEREMHQPNTKGHYGIRSVFGGRVDCGRIHRHLGVVAAVSKLGRTPGDSAADGRRICRPIPHNRWWSDDRRQATADGESTSDIDGQPTDHLGKRLVIALILTIPTFVITLLALAKIAMPGWLTNPWPHAIVITPVMFYCAAPIHHRGLPALQRRRPNGDSLVSLGMAIVYAYSLLLCVVSWIFPAARAIRISRSSAWSRRFRWLARLSGNTR